MAPGVDTASLVESSTLGFVNFHAYPGEDISLAESFRVPQDNPIVTGEVGGFIARYPDIDREAIVLQDWYAASCDVGLDGWLNWEILLVDTSVGDATWALVAKDNYLLGALAPVSQPAPRTQHISVRTWLWGRK